jgi:hypothetical protein
MPGRHQSESVADIASERPAEIVGIRSGDWTFGKKCGLGL